jgi:hypothetical protein
MYRHWVRELHDMAEVLDLTGLTLLRRCQRACQVVCERHPQDHLQQRH